jgi:hypothetical protein
MNGRINEYMYGRMIGYANCNEQGGERRLETAAALVLLGTMGLRSMRSHFWQYKKDNGEVPIGLEVRRIMEL